LFLAIVPAKQIDCTQGMTASGTMPGTPSFMAPEQVVASSSVAALVAITWLWRGVEGSRPAEELARQRTEQSLYAHSISMLSSQYRLNHISEN